MAQFFHVQLDYIFFFYGLAFLILAAVCLSLRHPKASLPWGWLALFGLTHGINEWLDLLAVSLGDTPYFYLGRVVILALSFGFLVEFGRVWAMATWGRFVGRWIYIPLLLLVGLGGWAGWTGINAAARLTLGFPGGLLAAVLFFLAWKRKTSGDRGWLAMAGAAMGLYAIATGLIVPQVPFPPGRWIHQEAFAEAAGVPIQLVRGVLAVGLALAAYGYSRILRTERGHRVYSLSSRLAALTATCLAALIAAGWVVTENEGRKTVEAIRLENELRAESRARRIEDTLTGVDHIAVAMAGSPWIFPALVSPGTQELEQANSVLDRYNAASSSSVCYLMDTRGKVIASSNRDSEQSFVGKYYEFRPYFRQAISGEPGRYYAVGVTSKERGYYSAQPVKDPDGHIVGVSVVKKDIEDLERSLRMNHPGHAYFVDPHGVAFLSSDTADTGKKTLWPLDAPTREKLLASRQFGDHLGEALLTEEPTRSEIFLGKEPHFLVRKAVGNDGWSVILIGSEKQVAANRLVVIAITLMVSLLVTGFFVVLVDRQRTTETLAKSETKFRTLYESSTDAVMLLDEKGFFDCNEATVRMFGCNGKDEYIQKHPAEISPPRQPCGGDSLTLARKKITEALQKGSNHFEWVHRRMDGSEFPAEVLLNAMNLDGRQVLQAVVRDISERKRSEEKARQLSARLEESYAAGHIGAIDLNIPENRVTWNEETFHIFGIPPQTDPLMLDQVMAMIHPDDRELHQKQLQEIPPGGTLDFEHRIIRPDGSVRCLMGKVQCECDREGRNVRMFGTVQDITDQKRQQEELTRATRLAEAANKAKSEFLANMSHEIRTPLTAILGYTELVAENLRCCTLCPEQEHCSTRQGNNEYMSVVLRNGRHLLELVNDILDLSKIEADKLVLEPRPCNIRALVSDVARMTQVRVTEKQLTLKTSYATPLPETILADEARLRQCLINLVGNAIKFTEKGNVEIRVGLIRHEPDAHAIRITVSDTGIGMSGETIEHLFQPFVQADSSTTRKYGGTGLGLAITKRIIEKMGGQIDVQSVPGQGSAFSLMLPTGPMEGMALIEQADTTVEETSTPSDPPKQMHPLHGLNILLAEDGPDNQLLIRTVLSRAGAEVVVAENGRLAIQEIGRQAFDLVLMDMQMPEMDGYEATRRLRAEGYPAPIIALTAHSLSGDRDRCLQAGCTDYLSKPIHRAALIELILKYVSPRQTSTAQPAMVEPERKRPEMEAIESVFADDLDLRDVLNDFVQQLPHRCRKIGEALSHNDFPGVQRLAHRIKGDGGGYGYPMLTQVGRELEAAAQTGDPETCKLKLAHLEILCRAIEQGWTSKTGSPSKA